MVVHLASVSIKNVSADSSVIVSADSFGRGEVVSADRLTLELLSKVDSDVQLP